MNSIITKTKTKNLAREGAGKANKGKTYRFFESFDSYMSSLTPENQILKLNI